MPFCDSWESLEGVKDGRVCARKEEQKRCRIRHVDSFAAKVLLE
jgi:hypothetical protein